MKSTTDGGCYVSGCYRCSINFLWNQCGIVSDCDSAFAPPKIWAASTSRGTEGAFKKADQLVFSGVSETETGRKLLEKAC